MYRIMLVAKDGNGEVNNLYKFFTVSNTEGKIVPYEAATLTEVDTQVEKMLNGDYKKKDLLIVKVSDFEVSANLDEVDTGSEGTGGSDGTENTDSTEGTESNP